MPVPRPSLPQELPRLRAFLPAPSGAHYLVVSDRREPSPERIVAAAAWWPAASASPDKSSGTTFCRWHVAPRWEAEGGTLAADLLDAVVAEAVAAGAKIIYTASLIPEESPFAALLAARGWTVADRNEFFEGPATGTWARLEKLYQHLATGSDANLATRFRAVPPTVASIPAIRALVLAERLVPDDELLYRFNHFDRPGGWSRFGSRVLLTTDPNPMLAGATLMRVDASSVTVHAEVVDREVCAREGISVGMANFLLLHAGMLSLRSSGADAWVHYSAHTLFHRRTANFALHCGLKHKNTSCEWQKSVLPVD